MVKVKRNGRFVSVPNGTNVSNFMKKSASPVSRRKSKRSSSSARVTKKPKKIIKPTSNKPKLASPTEFGLKKFNQFNNKDIPRKSSFTVASPVGRKNGKLIIQDFYFKFEKKRLVNIEKKKGKFPIDEKSFERKSGVSPLSSNAKFIGPRPSMANILR